MHRFTLAALVAALVVPSIALAHPSLEAHGHDLTFVTVAPAPDSVREDARARLDRIEAQRAKDEKKPCPAGKR